MGDARLPAFARDILADRSIEVHVSVVSLWEIGIKFALGRNGDPMPFSGKDAARLFDEVGFASLPVEARHATAVDDLPPLHRDPFDRLLIAQAMTEPMRFMTQDRALAPYSELVMLL